MGGNLQNIGIAGFCFVLLLSLSCNGKKETDESNGQLRNLGGGKSISPETDSVPKPLVVPRLPPDTLTAERKFMHDLLMKKGMLAKDFPFQKLFAHQAKELQGQGKAFLLSLAFDPTQEFTHGSEYVFLIIILDESDQIKRYKALYTTDPTDVDFIGTKAGYLIYRMYAQPAGIFVFYVIDTDTWNIYSTNGLDETMDKIALDKSDFPVSVSIMIPGEEESIKEGLEPDTWSVID